MPLIKRLTALSQATFGVGIFEDAPPSVVQGQGTNVVGMVMATPWGPEGELTLLTNANDVYRTFAPPEFGVLNNYPSLKALLNKRFPAAIEVVRVENSSAAAVAATQTFNDEDGTASVDVTANYPGAVGNLIYVEWTADSATNASATVTIVTAAGDTTYSRTYTDVVTGTTTVNDPGDPFVTFSANASMVKVPDTQGPTALASGTDGTAASTDWSGSNDFKGVNAFTSSEATADIVIGAEVPDGLIDDFNAALIADAEAAGFFPIKSTPVGDARADATVYTSPSTGTSTTGRGAYFWPRVTTSNRFLDNTDVVVDGNAFAAAAMASVEPEQSPAGAPGRPFLYGITGLETPVSRGDYELLYDAQVNSFVYTPNGYMIHGGQTITQTSGRELISTRRMSDFLAQSLAEYHTNFIGRLLDVDLTNRRLGPITAEQLGGHVAFLRNLVAEGRIRDFAVDPYVGQQSDIDSGQWRIRTQVKLFAPQNEIVLINEVGTTVSILEVA